MNGSILLQNINQPSEKRTLPKTDIDIVNLGDTTLMRVTFQPGWKWSECVKPTVGTDTCQAAHINYILSGRLKVVMDDGTEKEMRPGDCAVIAPGHDAWVIGDEPCIALDFSAGKMYGKK
ncbi:hypothetical protein AQUSIP_19270 [Aquicella siphonis]|uniref:Cupin type-2 domain-containing protein n=1 Tax=Aquicella siphonis TaxID=254247 RepID=A0A5E4PI46_9COXI|nr:cupin domain-containing protein [Aquicella siphonis]VVC76604.1 hypothetical protein AQUSIP_19270 [Aquicella siphonis]